MGTTSYCPDFDPALFSEGWSGTEGLTLLTGAGDPGDSQTTEVRMYCCPDLKTLCGLKSCLEDRVWPERVPWVGLGAAASLGRPRGLVCPTPLCPGLSLMWLLGACMGGCHSPAHSTLSLEGVPGPLDELDREP